MVSTAVTSSANIANLWVKYELIQFYKNKSWEKNYYQISLYFSFWGCTKSNKISTLSAGLDILDFCSDGSLSEFPSLALLSMCHKNLRNKSKLNFQLAHDRLFINYLPNTLLGQTFLQIPPDFYRCAENDLSDSDYSYVPLFQFRLMS